MAHWEHFHHQADIGVRGVSGTLEGAFEQAALALTAVITDPKLVTASTSLELECDAPDRELLLVDWLNALIYEIATRHMLFSRFEVSFTNERLQATAWGEPIDIDQHKPVVEIKGATYTELKVSKNQQGDWCAQCVVDV